jgi:UDP-2-acetamido-3-amino-2,3-dideoxy-glucuronate N-acetyltransferase
LQSAKTPFTKDPLNIGVVGCGNWGRNLVRVFQSLGVLNSICEPSFEGKEIARSIAPHTVLVEDFQEMLQDPAIDAVVIATPAATHAKLTCAALSANKHVFVEKPLAFSLSEGEEIFALANRAKRIVMVGHILSYHPAVLKLKELIDQGVFGKILYINSHRLNFGKVRREENILWSFAPHDISTILMLLEEFPEEVRCTGGQYLQKGIYDLTLTTLDFASGVKAHIFVSWMHPFKEQKLVVIGDKKMAVFDDTSDDKLILFPHTIEWQNRTVVTRKMKGEAIAIDATEPLLAECLHFLDCIRTGSTPKTDASEGLRVLEVLSASEESLRENGKAILPHGEKQSSYFVHPSSYIDKDVQIGEGTKIWHFSHILSKTRVGKNCVISQNVMIGPEVSIGDNVKIQNNVSIYKGVTLESDVFCGPSMVSTNVINPRSAIPRKSEFRNTHVGHGASLGANCTILAGTRIGRYAFIGAGAVVTKDIPDYAVVTGIPARLAGWMCECGVKLTWINDQGRCEGCERVYQLSGENTVEKIC